MKQGTVVHRRSLTAKIIAVTVSVVAMIAMSITPANAANYDSNVGRARTVSGAEGQFSALCGGTSGRLTNTFSTLNAVHPHYWHFTQRRVGGAWSNWSPWTAVPASNIGPNVPIIYAGDWQFVAEIAYWNGRAWEYDAEFVMHRNYNVATRQYVTTSSCHIG